MIRSLPYQEIIARIYYEASMAGADMAQTVTILTPLVQVLDKEPNVFTQWSAWDNAVVKAKGSLAGDALKQGRSAFIDKLLHLHSEEILNDPSCFKTIFLAYVSVWRSIHIKTILTRVLEKDSGKVPDADKWQTCIELIYQRRWVEVLPDIKEWQEYTKARASLHAHFLAVEAAIQIFYIGDYETSRSILDKALQVFPESSYALSMDAAWYAEQVLLDEARTRYQQLVLQPTMRTIGLNGLGTCSKKAEDFFTAEEWYVKVRESDPGLLETYQNLISLYGSQQRIYELRKNDIAALVETEILIEPLFEYEYYVDAGYACLEAKDLSASLHWNQKALALHTDRYEVYLHKANWLKAQLPAEPEEQKLHAFYSESIQLFRQAIQCAPACFDGYWGLYIVHKQALDYEPAIAVLQEAYPLCPEFYTLCRMEITDCYERLNQWQAATNNIVQALTDLPSSDKLIEHAEGFVERLAEYDASSANPFALTRDFYHQVCDCISVDKKLSFYTFITKAIAKRQGDEIFLIQVYQDAIQDFPHHDVFKTELEHIYFLQKYHKDKQPFVHQVTEIAVECDALVCDHFLNTERTEFLPAFWQKINDFKEQFHQRFGITLPPIIFRQYSFHSTSYHFFSTLDETFTTLGCLFYPEHSVVRCEALPFDAVESIRIYEPFFTLHWIKKEDLSKLPPEAVVLEPLDILFEHLQFNLWHQMKRFIHLDEPEIKQLSSGASDKLKVNFIQTLQLLAEYHVLLRNKEMIWHTMQQGLEREENIQEIAWQIMEHESFPRTYPYTTCSHKLYTLNETEEEHVLLWMQCTHHKQWAANTDPHEVQEILEALRALQDPFGRCLVSESKTAWILNTICNLEFPYFLFVTQSLLQDNTFDSNPPQKLQWL